MPLGWKYGFVLLSNRLDIDEADERTLRRNKNMVNDLLK
jgi:hypothetical protein